LSLAVAAVTACSRSPSAPDVASFDPPLVASDQLPVAGTLSGENLVSSPRISLDDHGSATLAEWQVAIDDVALDVDRASSTPTRLAVTIPPGLAPGAHDVSAIAPSTDVLVLPGALFVDPLAARLDVTSTTCGMPLDVTMTITNNLPAAIKDVAPTTLSIKGTGLGAVTGPTPATLAQIDPGSSGTVAWSYATTTCNTTVELSGGATGVDTTTGRSAPSPRTLATGTVFAAATCNAASCMAAGGACKNGVCAIKAGKSNTPACPAGSTCDIKCDADHDCLTSIDCSNAQACTISCLTDHSCWGAITCGGAGCTVECIGDHSCDGAAITCSAGASCDVHYGGPGCGMHSCGTNGAPPCSCSGTCSAVESCP
jgi:hypothetical protein